MITVFFVSIFFLVYIYMLFPGIIYVLGKLQNERVPLDSCDGSSSIVIVVPAHNEESVIEKKITNHLGLNYPDENYKILVISDTSTDDTSEIARKYVDLYPNQVELFEVFDGLGKTNAINKALQNVECDILVFSDANVYLKEDALQQIEKCFKDETIGGVAGQLNYTNSEVEGAATSNGLYWQYEEMIKKSESLTGSMMGADGSIFSIRRDLFKQLPLHVLDDFCSSIGVVLQGHKLKFDDTILAYEKGAESTNEEFARKIRISNRSYNSYLHLRKDLLKNLSMFDIWKFYSHKVLRWYSLVFMVLAFASNVSLAITQASPFWSTLLVLHDMFYAASVLSWIGKFPKLPIISKIAVISEYFTMANVATGIGIFKSLLGKKIVVWKKADSTR